MPFITTLTLRSGDRETLDEFVSDLKTAAERKGIELKGPHTHPLTSYTIPLYRQMTGGAEFTAWQYTVYERVLRLAGHDETVRRITDADFPRGVHVEVEVDQITSTGQR